MKKAPPKSKLNRNLALILLGLGIICAIIPSQPSEKELRSKVVKLISKNGVCSGEQVRAPSGKDYILSAAHCKEIAIEGSFEVVTEDGKHLQRRLIAEDPNSDLLLIEGVPNLEGLHIAKKIDLQDHVRTFTHGHNFDTYKTEGIIADYKEIIIPMSVVEGDDGAAECKAMPKYDTIDIDLIVIKLKVCVLKVKELATTALIVPGSSGGEVIDDSGKLCGVVSAAGEGFGYLTPVSDINKFLSGY